MPIKISIRGIEAVQEYLKTVPRGAMKDALEAFTKYIVGDKQHGLKHSDPYKYVSRAAAYGQTGARFDNGNLVPPGYFSKEQFFYVMAKIHSGQIDPGSGKRSGDSTGAWTFKPTNGGYGYTISNPTAGAYYTQSDTGQARQPAMVGWRKVMQNMADNTVGAMRMANAAVKRRLAQKK